ncbi:hypothetical protein B0H16DRAFT_1321167 [Mycena metata]|uniref:Uncharacterized protein n=1 Tax=Mycena metata TaxID=1033252 RepID=A0AAD7IPW8_9AGAR|nr:hypothetical protein B0H16DRAFT_1321167 [Mycena metata]
MSTAALRLREIKSRRCLARLYPWRNGRIVALFVSSYCAMEAGSAFPLFSYTFNLSQENATVPQRIFKKRSVSGAWFASCLGATYFIVVSYFPSGIDTFPMIFALVATLDSLLGDQALITAVRYYQLIMVPSSVLTTVGAGLPSTLKTTSGHAH